MSLDVTNSSSWDIKKLIELLSGYVDCIFMSYVDMSAILNTLPQFGNIFANVAVLKK